MNMKRMRGRNNRGGGGGQGGGHGGGHGGGGGGGPIRHQSGNTPMNRNHVFDSIGPDLRIRGTSQLLFEKYLQLGRDATSSGDRVMAESYFQYAEHYFRIMTAMNQAAQQSGQQPMQGGQQYAGPQHGGPQYNQRRNDGNGDQQDDMQDDGSDSMGSEQPETRAIPIAAGAPERPAE